MNELLLHQIQLEQFYHQTHHDELLRQSRETYILHNLKTIKPSFWDSTLFNTGNLLISWGEKLRRNRGSIRLSEGCQ